MSNQEQPQNTAYPWYGYPYGMPPVPPQPAAQTAPNYAPPVGAPPPPFMWPPYPGYAMPWYPGAPVPPPPAWPGQASHHHHSHAPSPADAGLYQQAQGMVEELMGEQSGIFKHLLSTLGVDDKEFWKGAMMGAAAALILSNENVRSTLLQLVANAGDLLKTGGGKVKDSVTQTASSVKDNLATGGTIFRDTVQAGKEGFRDSVARHKTDAAPLDDSEATEPERNEQ
ncbi:hypothetical protein FJU30_16895 [Affinibrenneria salicis]|uniref:YtxH domain-containing protein n=1 Tax=Affinibrenneria salicis TaxID=2590031 RepID=A0A5J5FWB1_9GAMM|nr:hypothetical protein [Affinibrenneria salicis]KAA8998095.1 hypothetical protein FJU30_16895 [Affinibrenneria salicis]